MSRELKFASTDAALQHLADVTGKRVKVADAGFHPLIVKFRTNNEPWSHVGYFQEVNGGERDKAYSDFISGVRDAVGSPVDVVDYENADIDWDKVKKLSMDKQEKFIRFVMKENNLTEKDLE